MPPAFAPRCGTTTSPAVAAVALAAAATASAILVAQNEDVGNSNGERSTEDDIRRRATAAAYRGPAPATAVSGVLVGNAVASSSAPLRLDGPRWYTPIANPEMARCEADGPTNAEPSLNTRSGGSSGSNEAKPTSSSSSSSLPTSPSPPPAPAVPSRTRRLLHALRLVSLPVPRTLTPSDPVFEYPALRSGLRRRAADEIRLRSLQGEAVAARNSGDAERIKAVFGRISAVAYGEGVTPQEREDYLVKYGCTGWTDDILTYLVGLASDRGIVEIGAGNGQWSRAIQDRHAELWRPSLPTDHHSYVKPFDFIIPYDDMTNLPLSPKVYHRHTQPYHENFHPNVRKCTSHVDAVRKWESRGRVLLLVYPPPGPFAVETVREYVNVSSRNDTVVYVGEGRGGANADDDLFDYFLKGGDWALVETMGVRPGLGGKGYERMFVLRKLK